MVRIRDCDTNRSTPGRRGWVLHATPTLTSPARHHAYRNEAVGLSVARVRGAYLNDEWLVPISMLGPALLA